MLLEGVPEDFLMRSGGQGQDAGTPAGLPGGVRDAGDAQVLSRGACCARPRQQNAVEPGIQYVLAQ
jgi:hypothetical protein